MEEWIVSRQLTPANFDALNVTLRNQRFDKEFQATILGAIQESDGRSAAEYVEIVSLLYLAFCRELDLHFEDDLLLVHSLLLGKKIRLFCLYQL